VGLLEGKVVFITGAARGQGRSHALRCAAEGADVALVDLGAAGKVETPPYVTATSEQLAGTKAEVEAQGRRAVSFEVDVRDYAGLAEAAKATARELGGIDCVVANAGISDAFYPVWDLPVENWHTMIDINLTGVYYTCRATVPYVRARGEGGSLVLVSSVAALKSYGWLSHYSAAKWGVRGLAIALAKELAAEYIRCNSLHPGAIYTDMTDAMVYLSNSVTKEQLLAQFRDQQLLARNIETRDSTAAVVWLLSDESRFVTGQEFVVDGGESKK
jgi:NAD(P)-dependent dehydrogenase (short-subunit alcohol dehydrogenase family)